VGHLQVPVLRSQVPPFKQFEEQFRFKHWGPENPYLQMQVPVRVLHPKETFDGQGGIQFLSLQSVPKNGAIHAQVPLFKHVPPFWQGSVQFFSNKYID
jgi:hypothetical protein